MDPNEQFPIETPEQREAEQDIPLEGDPKSKSNLQGLILTTMLLYKAYTKLSTPKNRIMENDKNYLDKRNEALKEWRENNKEKVGTEEEIDFIYGKLDGDKPSLLKTKTEEAFQKDHQAKYDKYKKNRDWNKNPRIDVTFNQYLKHQDQEIQAHSQARIDYLKSLGNYKHWWNRTGKPEYKHRKNLIKERVREKAWEDFVHLYPEKAKEYSKGKKWYSSQISNANQRLEGKNETESQEATKGKEEERTAWVKKELGDFAGRPRDEGGREVEYAPEIRMQRASHDTSLEEANRRLEQAATRGAQMQESQSLHGLVTPSGQPISRIPSVPSSPPSLERSTGRLRGRRGPIDGLNRLINKGRKIKAGAGIKKQLAKKAASTVGKMALKNPYVLAALLIICAIVLLIILILGGGASQEQIRRDDNVINGTPIPGLTLTKTGPDQVDNGQNIKFTITVTYSGSDEILLVDEISANDGEIIKEGTTGILSGITSTRAVWNLKANTPNNGIYSFDLMVKPLRENFSFKNTVIATDMTTQNLLPPSDLDGLLPQTEQTDLTMQKQKEVADLLSKPDNISNVIIYKEASQTTGIAWEILAGLHYREGSMGSNSSLVSGRKIGQVEPDVRFCEKEYQVGQPYRVGGGCVFKTLLDTAIYAGNHLKGKNFGNIPSTSAEIVLALSKYNGGGNSNCGDTPYPNCPPLYFGEDDTYVMNAYDKKHETMYIVYCADHVRCNPPKKDSRPGVLSAIIGVIKYMNN